ncbi:PAS domain-containing protein [Kordiimonas gwangyangensis]|uniref:PAS domain-containing protein n=1 Tax=Kordiimonas gwangyangensis TaxID=288022 RepID=UPI00039AB974|nr:PAS domain-containing protein [Kordiimonas gwangyangensis]
MSDRALPVTGVEVYFGDDEIIVSKTDLKGYITYANDVFLNIAGYAEDEVLGQPHSMIRHPDMPRAVFKLLWEHLKSGEEIFAYVMNRAKNGDHYWVLAHVTPSLDAAGTIVGYHSNRRVPKRDTINNVIIPLYKQLRALEMSGDRKAGLEASSAKLEAMLKEKGMTANQLFLSLA